MDASRGGDVESDLPPANTLESQARPSTSDRLEAVLEHDDGPLVYWEAPDGTRLAGTGDAFVLTAESGGLPVGAAERILDRVRYDGPDAARPRMLGGRAFDPTNTSDATWASFPATSFVLPRHLVIEREGECWHTVTGEAGTLADAHAELSIPDDRSPTSGILGTTPIPDRDAWIERVGSLRERIANGDYRKVVAAHARDVTFDRPPSPRACVHRLRRTNPGCVIALVSPDGGDAFVSATPERLVERRGPTIRSEALAGTVGRGSTNDDDDRLSDALQSNEKERHEHRLVVDAIRSILGDIGADVQVEERRVQRLRAIQHLYTPITADHPDPPHVLSLVDALHPTPAVGGIPREAALAAIRDVEDVARGWYAGPIGWFDANGDGTFAIGIRSGVIRDDRARIFAGAGIVSDSDPADEWTEVQWKYRPFLDAFPDA